MSRAMALTCKGTVYILADDIDQPFKKQDHEPTPSIWLTHEAPVLQGLLKQRTITALKAIQYKPSVFLPITIKDVTEDLQNFVPPDGSQPFRRDEFASVAPIIARKRSELAREQLQNNATMPDGNIDLVDRAISCGAYSQEAPLGDYFG